MFWEIFDDLCKQNGISATAVCKKLSIASGMVTEWKKARTPYNATLKKIADYFNVSVDYLLGKEEKTDMVDELKIGMRIKQRRQELQMTQEQLGIKLQLNKSTIQRYESGQVKNIKLPVLQSIAEQLDVDTSWLVCKTNVMGSFKRSERQPISNYLEQYGLMPIKHKKIRTLGETACGEPIFCDEEYDTFVDASANIDADFCLKAKGDSMINARIYDGDIVFIKQTTMVNNGEIAAVIVGDEAMLRRVYYNEDNTFVLSAENPQYEALVYTKEELNNINILGRAVAFMSHVK